ncbi:hypothetical protein GCM10022284_63970 [Streptomyces hundungensis]
MLSQTVTVTVSSRARKPSSAASTAKASPYSPARDQSNSRTEGPNSPRPAHNDFDLDLAWNTIDHTHPPKDTDTLSPTAPAFPGSVRSPPDPLPRP